MVDEVVGIVNGFRTGAKRLVAKLGGILGEVVFVGRQIISEAPDGTTCREDRPPSSPYG